MDCSLPGSSVHGILQARILVWVAISFSRKSFRPREPRSPELLVDSLLTELPGKPNVRRWFLKKLNTDEHLCVCVCVCVCVLSHSVMSDSLSDPMDCSPPGLSVHGTFSARVLE